MNLRYFGRGWWEKRRTFKAEHGGGRVTRWVLERGRSKRNPQRTGVATDFEKNYHKMISRKLLIKLRANKDVCKKNQAKIMIKMMKFSG